MSDSTPNLQQIIAGANADTRVNEVHDALSPSALYGRNAQTVAGLTWGYYGGYYNGNEVANGTISLTANATNYLVAHRTTGVVTASTSTTNWNNAITYIRLYEIVVGASTITSYKDRRQSLPVQAPNAASVQSIIIACGDESSALTPGNGKVTFRMPYAFTLSEVRASLTIVATGGLTTIDINQNGTSILSTKLTLDASEKSSKTAATPPVMSTTALTDDAEITVDVDSVAGAVSGAGLKVVLIGVPV